MRKNKYRKQIAAVRKANKGKTLTRTHKARIRRSVKAHDSDTVVKAYRDGEVLTFKTCSECADAIGCTKQLVSQCIRRPETFKSARGYVIRLVKEA